MDRRFRRFGKPILPQPKPQKRRPRKPKRVRKRFVLPGHQQLYEALQAQLMDDVLSTICSYMPDRMTLELHRSWVDGVALSSDGCWLASASNDCCVCVVDLSTGTRVATVTNGTVAVRTVSLCVRVYVGVFVSVCWVWGGNAPDSYHSKTCIRSSQKHALCFHSHAFGLDAQLVCVVWWC